MPDINIHEVIKANLIDQDPDKSCEAVFDVLGVPAKWRAVFFPLVKEQCAHAIRLQTRLLEEAFALAEAEAAVAREEARRGVRPSKPRSTGGSSTTSGQSAGDGSTTAVMTDEDDPEQLVRDHYDIPLTELRKQHHARTFYNGETNVSWGKATIEDHEKRIEYLQKFRKGLQDTSDRHVMAIMEIKAAGVTCLDEIPKAVG